MWYLLLIGIVFLAPVLESIITFIINKIEIKRKWHPFADEYNKSLEDANGDSFFMVMEPNVKATVLVGIIGFAFLWLSGAASVIIAYLLGKMRFWDSMISVIFFSACCLPVISVFLHFFSKKIYFSEETVFVKSIFIKKRINIKDLTEVKEDIYNRSKFFRATTADMLILIFGKHKVKITKNYSNYKLARTRLINR